MFFWVPSFKAPNMVTRLCIFWIPPCNQRGRWAVASWLRSPVEHVRDLRIEFIAKLFFFQRLSVKGGEDLIKIQIESLEGLKKKFKKERDKEKDPFKKLVFGIKIITIEGWIKWLRKEAMPFIGKA